MTIIELYVIILYYIVILLIIGVIRHFAGNI